MPEDTRDALSIAVAVAAIFCVKLVGYWAAGAVLARGIYERKGTGFLFALSRTALGFLVYMPIVVATYFGSSAVADMSSETAGVAVTVMAFVLHAALRFVFGLGLTIAWFDRTQPRFALALGCAVGLLVWSYLLDLVTYALGTAEVFFLLSHLSFC